MDPWTDEMTLKSREKRDKKNEIVCLNVASGRAYLIMHGSYQCTYGDNVSWTFLLAPIVYTCCMVYISTDDACLSIVGSHKHSRHN